MDWARILAYVTGTVDQELLARNEYLAAENRILKAKLNGRPKLSDAERATLGEIGHRLGRKALSEVATVARPDTYPGLVPQACRPQVRWLESPSRPRQTADQARGRGADRSHGRGEPLLGL
jgi:hypothetical protein